MDYPHINLCFPFDITVLQAYCRENGLSVTHAILYLSARTANSIKEFRLRIRGEQVVVHDHIDPSYTVLREDAKTLMERAAIQQKKVYAELVLEDDPGRDDYLYISVLPWISFTNTTHPVHMNPVDSVPRLVWGKFYTNEGKTMLPCSSRSC